MAKKKDINDVTDEISLIMREVVEATESNLLFEIANTLEKHSDGVKSSEDYLRKQMSENKALQQRMQRIAREGEQIQINVAKNIGIFAGINTAPLEQEIKKGTKIVLDSGMDEKNKQVQKIYRLNKFNTSAQFIPDLKQSIIKQTEEGIEKGIDITYKGGRKIGYREYMEMAVRTGIQQEIGEQQIEIAKQANIVFFVCDEYADCADDHADYQGKIYYNEDYKNFNLTEQAKQMIANAIKSKQLLSVQEVRDDKPYLTTRPNCRHRLIPISIDEAIGEDLSKVKQSVDSVRGNYRPENYEASQQQRAYERAIRNNKKVLDFFEKKKGEKKSNEYDKVIQARRNAIARNQLKLRQLLQSNPTLSRERRRETRNILIKDLGVKYNLKNMKNEPPTPVTNNPPPTPPVTNVEAQKKMDETVKSHYAMPEEKKVYIKQKYDIDWGIITFNNKAPLSASLKSLNQDVNEWHKIIDGVGIPPEQDTEERRKVLFFYKDAFKVTKLTDASYKAKRAKYSPSDNMIYLHRVASKDGYEAISNATVVTHELGHAIDHNIANKFGFTNKHSVGISNLGTATPIRALARFYNVQPKAEEVVEAMKNDKEVLPEQIELLKGSVAFNQGIRNAEIKGLPSDNGFITDQGIKVFYDGLKGKETFDYMLSAKKEFDGINQEALDFYDYNNVLKQAQKRYNELASGLDKMTLEEKQKARDEMNAIYDNSKKLRVKVEERVNEKRGEFMKNNAGYENLTDFYDALSQGRFLQKGIVRFGHGTAYYSRTTFQAVEIFTHINTIQIHQPELYKKLKKDYPDMIGGYEKMIDVSTKVYTDNIKEKVHKGSFDNENTHIGKSFDTILDNTYAFGQ